MASENRGFSLFWRKDKRRWIYSAPDSFGVWRQKYVPPEYAKKDERAAEQWIRETLAGAVKQTKAPDGPTTKDAAEKWIALRRKNPKLKPATVVDNDVHLRKYILPKFGEERLARLADAVPTLRAWLREVRDLVSASRCRNIVSTFRNFLDDAKAEGWVRYGENPLKSTAIIRELPELPVGEPIYISMQDAQALIQAEVVPEPRRVRYALAFTTGMADGEISGLQWGDIDGKSLRVQRAALLIKRRKDEPLGTPKNRFRVRRVPLHDAAVAALEYWRSTVAIVLGHDPLPTDPIFPGMKRGGHARPDSAKLIRRDLVSLHLPTDHRASKEEIAIIEKSMERFDFRATRRSFLTYLADLGVDHQVRKRLAGHSRSDVTEAHYTAREIDSLRAAVNRIPLAWEAAGTVPNHCAGMAQESED
jgi:integrase